MSSRPEPLEASRFATLRERTLEKADEIPETIGRYRVYGELGRGGMGIVYHAYDPTLARAVAVKVIRRERIRGAGELREFAERFQREMQATSGIFHSNVVAILDAGAVHGDDGLELYYVMERIEGYSLEQLLRDRGTLSRGEGLRIAAAIARGLAAAHRHGLIHRDLKPSNVLLPEGREPKVADFGLCSFRDELAGEDRSRIRGSVHYLAPEQVRCERVGERADLFALGALLIRMFSGAEPFASDSIASHFQRVESDEPDGLEALDPDVRNLVMRLMAKRADQRPASAEAVARELEELAGEAGSMRSPKRRARASRSGRRAAVGGAAVVMLVGVSAAVHEHNELVALETSVQIQWEQVQNQIARQRELLPKLARLTHLPVERDGSGSAAAPTERTAQALGPEYRALVHEIAGTENRISVERKRYNELVGAFNQRLARFPGRLFSSFVTPRAFLEAGEGSIAGGPRRAAAETTEPSG